jgi:hypothetical protein
MASYRTRCIQRRLVNWHQGSVRMDIKHYRLWVIENPAKGDLDRGDTRQERSSLRQHSRHAVIPYFVSWSGDERGDVEPAEGCLMEVREFGQPGTCLLCRAAQFRTIAQEDMPIYRALSWSVLSAVPPAVNQFLRKRAHAGPVSSRSNSVAVELNSRICSLSSAAARLPLNRG